jgi:hypothetical protein
MSRIKISRGLLAVFLALPWAAYAQGQGAAAIQKKLESEYQLTKTNDDRSDIVTAGSVLILHKDKVLMIASSSSVGCMNTYRDGKITPKGTCGFGDRVGRVFKKWPGSAGGGGENAPATHTFVSGEKFWVTRINVTDSGKQPGIVFDFFTDAINDVRFKGALLIPFGATTPTPDEALQLVGEVITVAPSDDVQSGDKMPPATPRGAPAPVALPAAAATAEAPPPALDIPAPPQADPPVISEGQTIAQVTAALGQPLKKAKIGTKDIYTYKDLKVTFVNGKVKDVQ